MNDRDILDIQRALRHRLFEGSGAIRWRPGRELVAQLLLYLDDPQACWRISAEWLRDTLDADRVDGGFGGFIDLHGEPRDYVALAEVQRSALRLPSVLGLRFSAVDPGVRAAWHAHELIPFVEVAQERGMSEQMRSTLRSVGTAAKLALPVRDGAQPVGLICADWHREAPRWNMSLCREVGALVQGALGPLLATSAQFAHQAASPQALDVLTPAELKVARLVATGLSYKEVARQLGRSFSTVDHQLRSIRDKLGVRSTAKLVHRLNEHLEARRH